MACPPISPFTNSKLCPNFSPTTFNTLTASGTISRPTPSPANTAILAFTLSPRSVVCAYARAPRVGRRSFQYPFVFYFPSRINNTEKLDVLIARIFQRLFSSRRHIQGHSSFNARHLVIDHEPPISCNEIVHLGGIEDVPLRALAGS